MKIKTNFTETSTASQVRSLTADDLITVNGGLLTGGEVPNPPVPPPSAGGAMGMKDNWKASQTNQRWSN